MTIEISSEAVRKPDVGHLFKANRDELAMALSAVIEEGIVDGVFNGNSNNREAALIILDLVEGASYRCLIDEVSMRKVAKGVQEFVARALA